MQIKISGEMKLSDIRQIIFEKLAEVEDDYFIHFTAGATLYINPTDGKGARLTPVDEYGKEVPILYTKARYRSIAEDYDL